MSLTKDILILEPEKTCNQIRNFIKDYVNSAKANGVVLGISGGIDSALTAKLSVDALGADSVLGLILPEESSNPNDEKDALELINQLGIEYEKIDITPMIKSFDNMCEHFSAENKTVAGNLRPRIRMQILYYHANIMNRLVVGTGNKAELYVGYFTKYGDGGVDFEPIADLYKTQVREMAQYLAIPDRIISKVSRPGLWIKHTAEGEIGLSFAVVDGILKDLENENFDRSKYLDKDVKRIHELMQKNKHKSEMPTICKIESRFNLSVK